MQMQWQYPVYCAMKAECGSSGAVVPRPDKAATGNTARCSLSVTSVVSSVGHATIAYAGKLLFYSHYRSKRLRVGE